MYQRILVATDGSFWAEAAVTYGIVLAASLEIELLALTVLSPSFLSVAYVEDSSSYTATIEELARQSQMFLARAVDAANEFDVFCRPMWTWGDVAATILRTASEENCDLIILGSRPLKRWKPHLLGGACSTVAAKAPQPVLIVKPSFLLPLDWPLWRRILVATSESHTSDAAVAHALTLAQNEAIELHLVHVESGGQAWRDCGAMPCSEGERALILGEARAAAAGVAAEPCLVSGHLTRTILEIARVRECDVIILGSRRRTSWQSLTDTSVAWAVAARSSLPVLIVKPS